MQYIELFTFAFVAFLLVASPGPNGLLFVRTMTAHGNKNAYSNIGTSQASAFIFLVPFFAITLSNIFLDEEIYITTILGTILTIIAVYTLNKK